MSPAYQNKFKKGMNWVNQVAVFRFNSRKYDLNQVKEDFIKTLSNMNDMTDTKKDNSYMFLMTSSFKFSDVKNYLAPGFSYDRMDARCKRLFFHMNG